MSRDSFIRSPFIVGLILVGPLLPSILSIYWVHVFAIMFIKIILAVALRQMLLTGMLNLACAAFMAIGAYFTAALLTYGGISFWLVMPFAGITCSFLGLALGFPLFRMKGAYFFIGTVCFAIIVETFFSNFFLEVFGGVPGFTPIAKPQIKILGLDIKFISKISYYYLSYFVMICCLLAMYRLENSRFGQYWKAIRDADRLIESVGVDLFKHKMFNFAICCFISGLCGSVYAPFIGIITPHDFSLDFVFLIVMYVVVGGSQKFWGPVIGVTALSFLGELFRGLGQYELFSYGIVLVAALLFLPNGLIGVLERAACYARLATNELYRISQSRKTL